MCDTFMTLTCHTNVICLSFIILFATHESYGLILKPYESSPFINFLQNSITLCSRTYSTFLIWVYKIGFPLLLIMAYFLYVLDANFAVTSASYPYINMILFSSVSVCRYSPVMSKLATSQIFFASTSSVMNTDYVATVYEPPPALLVVYG